MPYAYTIMNDAVTITRYNGPGGRVVITNAMEGYPVTSIGEFSFRDCTALTRVQLPPGVTHIGDWAFGNCTNLTDIVLPPHVARLEEYFRIGINGWQIAAMLDKDERVDPVEQKRKYGCVFVKRPGAWMTTAGFGNDGLLIFEPRSDAVTYWLKILDGLASKHGVVILRRQALERIETKDCIELPCLCKEWNGTLEGFAGFLSELRQQGFMIDVGSVTLRPLPQREGIYQGSFSVRCTYTIAQASPPAVAPSQP